MPATKTIQNSLDWATYFVGNRGAFFTNNEPGLTSANLVAQIMLQPPMKWRWNRSTVSFQMINPAGWVANQALPLGVRIKDSNGNMQKVTTQGTTGFVVPTWNRNILGSTNDGSVVWTTYGINDYTETVTDFGFLEKAYMQDPATRGNGKIIEVPYLATELSQDSGTDQPTSIAPYLETLAGAITFRVLPGIPDKLYQMDVIYQKKPAIYTLISNPWNIPDEYMYIYNMGFLAFMYMFADSPKFQVANSKFISGLLGAQEGLSEQQIAVFLGQYDFILQGAMRSQAKTQQGFAGRGV